MTLGDLGEQAIVALGEVITNLAELLVYDVKVVQQPFLGRYDLALASDGLDDIPVCPEQYTSVFTHSR
jgi:hypothetical protein